MTDDPVPDELDVAGQAVKYGDRAAIVRGSERITLPTGKEHIRLWIDVDGRSRLVNTARERVTLI